MSATKSDTTMLAQSVMQRQPVMILESDTIRDAVDKMSENHVSALPVVDPDGLLVGILTINDLLRLVQQAEQVLEDRFPIYEDCFWVTELIRDTLGDDEVTSAMSGAPVTARPDDTITHVAQLMLEHQIHHVPITSGDKKLIGIISAIDFVRLAATPE